MINKKKKYWIKKNFNRACPNVSLFRFLNNIKFNYKNKKVLEVGFGFGADLCEFKERGSKIWGVDISSSAVKIMKIIKKNKNIKRVDCAKEDFKFGNTKFDLIYTRDTISYFTYKEIFFFIKNVFNSLKEKGVYLFQYIESDYKYKNSKNSNNNYLNIKKFYKKTKFTEKNNPLRFLNFQKIFKICKKVGLKYINKKILIESYGKNDDKLRINRYLIFEK